MNQFKEGTMTMSTTLYVGNIPWNSTPDEIGEFFGSYGHVESSRIIIDRETGHSRGFGFIEVGEADAAHMAEELNGMDFRGLQLTVGELDQLTSNIKTLLEGSTPNEAEYGVPPHL